MKICKKASKRTLIALSASFCLWSQGAAGQPATRGPETPVTHVGPTEAQKLITEKKVVVLDLRTPGEFNSGSLPGATNIDFLASDFSQRLNALDKTKAYLVHCASGGRSTQSLKVFQTQKFQSVYHLDGGIKAWKKAGLPLESNSK
jgi:rhodanese-related sulfurtransferase